MRKGASNNPGNKVSSYIVFWIGGNGEYDSFSLEEGLEIWNAAMINIGIRVRQPPFLGKDVKMRFHFFVNVGLKINSKFAVGPD